MRRRDFVKVIASSAAAWPLVARAQQSKLVRLGYLGAMLARPPTRSFYEKKASNSAIDQGGKKRRDEITEGGEPKLKKVGLRCIPLPGRSLARSRAHPLGRDRGLRSCSAPS